MTARERAGVPSGRNVVITTLNVAINVVISFRERVMFQNKGKNRDNKDGTTQVAKGLGVDTTWVVERFNRITKSSCDTINADFPRAPGPRRCQHDHDLHPRFEPGWTWRLRPLGSPVTVICRHDILRADIEIDCQFCSVCRGKRT